MATIIEAQRDRNAFVISPAERQRLVRLCLALTGRSDVAEDLAQETLWEAWRSAHKLEDATKQRAWLSGIARNVCRRWLHAQARDQKLLATSQDGYLDSLSDETGSDPDGFDLEVELDRSELATLLDRALAYLPVQSRAVLLGRIVKDLPQAALAEQLGLSEGAVAVRLHRGKLALRQVLETELRNEFEPYGLPSAAADSWQTTPIWCTICGQHRLIGRLAPECGEFFMRCPVCHWQHGIHATQNSGTPELFTGVQGFRGAYDRVEIVANESYQQAIATNIATCAYCGQPATVHRWLPGETAARTVDSRGVHIRCTVCQKATWMSLTGLALCLPEGRRFQHEHPRIRTLRERDIEIDGTEAIVVGFESVTDSYHLDVILRSDSLRTITIHTNASQ